MILTKTLQLTDLDELAPELVIVDKYFHAEREQHELRRWEYAMALRAREIWGDVINVAYDVGGAGSPFQHMLPVCVIDPDAPGGMSLAAFVQHMNPPLADAVFCLSVLEHVENLPEFLYHLSCLMRPGGLLFLTMDVTEGLEPEQVHFAHMRKRIFTGDPMGTWWQLAADLTAYSFSLLGDRDWHYHSHTLYGSYSFASLAMVKA
jgi:Methyltransferase domain